MQVLSVKITQRRFWIGLLVPPSFFLCMKNKLILYWAKVFRGEVGITSDTWTHCGWHASAKKWGEEQTVQNLLNLRQRSQFLGGKWKKVQSKLRFCPRLPLFRYRWDWHKLFSLSPGNVQYERKQSFNQLLYILLFEGRNCMDEKGRPQVYLRSITWALFPSMMKWQKNSSL